MKFVMVTESEKLERHGVTYKLDKYRTFKDDTIVYNCIKLNEGPVGFVGKNNGYFGPICQYPEIAFRRAREVAINKSECGVCKIWKQGTADLMKLCISIANCFTRSK